MPPKVLYLHPRLRGAMTEAQADAMDYIDRRIGHVIQLPTLSMPIWVVSPDDLPPPAAPAAPPPRLAA